MCKQPNVFWCDNCELYVSHTALSQHKNGEPHRCPSCGRELEPHYIPPPDGDFWCPTCRTHVQKANAIPSDGLKPISCYTCGSDLEPAFALVHNPISLPFALTLLGVVARLLIRSGAMDSLDEHAKTTNTKLDDFALQVARALVLEAAKL